jgi:hypothetical protein
VLFRSLLREPVVSHQVPRPALMNNAGWCHTERCCPGILPVTRPQLLHWWPATEWQHTHTHARTWCMACHLLLLLLLLLLLRCAQLALQVRHKVQHAQLSQRVLHSNPGSTHSTGNTGSSDQQFVCVGSCQHTPTASTAGQRVCAPATHRSRLPRPMPLAHSLHSCYAARGALAGSLDL